MKDALTGYRYILARLYSITADLWVDESRYSKGSHTACAESKIGVDQGSHLGVTFRGCSRVEAWPEHPEECCSYLVGGGGGGDVVVVLVVVLMWM